MEPPKPKLIARSQLTERGPLGFGRSRSIFDGYSKPHQPVMGMASIMVISPYPFRSREADEPERGFSVRFLRDRKMAG